MASCHAHLQKGARASESPYRVSRRSGVSHALDGVLLEVVPEAEVAQHLKEGVVPLGHAHILDVVGAHTLLGGCRARHDARRLCVGVCGPVGRRQHLEPDPVADAGQRACPRKMGLNCSMPAMVSNTVGSSGTRDELGSTLCPREAKNSCGRQRPVLMRQRRLDTTTAATSRTHQEAPPDGGTTDVRSGW